MINLQNSLNHFIQSEYGSFLGKTVFQIRPLRQSELQQFGWTASSRDCPMVIIFSDGQALIPSCDPEGNGPGFLLTADLPK